MAENINITVAFATASRQTQIAVILPAPATIADAIAASNIGDNQETNLVATNFGIFGKVCAPSQPLQDGDRVEIYRPLLQTPTAARRKRAQKYDA